MELLAVLPEADPSPPLRDPEITRVRHDSREVLRGDLFVALPGAVSGSPTPAGLSRFSPPASRATHPRSWFSRE